MILGCPTAKQGLFRTKHGGAGGIILWALLTVFLVLWWACAAHIQIWVLLTRSQSRVSDTQVIVMACGPFFHVSDLQVYFPLFISDKELLSWTCEWCTTWYRNEHLCPTENEGKSDLLTSLIVGGYLLCVVVNKQYMNYLPTN